MKIFVYRIQFKQSERKLRLSSGIENKIVIFQSPLQLFTPKTEFNEYPQEPKLIATPASIDCNLELIVLLKIHVPFAQIERVLITHQ